MALPFTGALGVRRFVRLLHLMIQIGGFLRDRDHKYLSLHALVIVAEGTDVFCLIPALPYARETDWKLKSKVCAKSKDQQAPGISIILLRQKGSLVLR